MLAADSSTDCAIQAIFRMYRSAGADCAGFAEPGYKVYNLSDAKTASNSARRGGELSPICASSPWSKTSKLPDRSLRSKRDESHAISASSLWLSSIVRGAAGNIAVDE
jgi:hypothetical protein